MTESRSITTPVQTAQYMTVVWLVSQLICFPILLTTLLIKILYSLAQSRLNGLISMIVLNFYVCSCYLPILLIWIPIPIYSLAIAAIALPTIYITSNLLQSYRLTTILSVLSMFAMHYFFMTTSWFAPISVFSLFPLLNALWWTTLAGCAITQNVMNWYYPTCSEAELHCIKHHLLPIMVQDYGKQHAPQKCYKDYWYMLSIFSVQSKYETMLKMAEQQYTTLINKTTDPAIRNFLLCKLVHIMCSDTLKMDCGELKKHSLLPELLRHIAGDFYFFTLEQNQTRTIIFSGTSFLPNPCPSIFWSSIGNMTPGCSVGSPLLWLGKSRIHHYLQTNPETSIDYIGFSMGGSTAKLACLLFPEKKAKAATFNAPGLLTWKSRAHYLLTLAILWIIGLSSYSLLTTSCLWPPLWSIYTMIHMIGIALLLLGNICCMMQALHGEDDKILKMPRVTSHVNAADCITNVATQPEKGLMNIYKAVDGWFGSHLASPIAEKLPK